MRFCFKFQEKAKKKEPTANRFAGVTSQLTVDRKRAELISDKSRLPEFSVALCDKRERILRFTVITANILHACSILQDIWKATILSSHRECDIYI